MANPLGGRDWHQHVGSPRAMPQSFGAPQRGQ
jgi:hypothetical protein